MRSKSQAEIVFSSPEEMREEAKRLQRKIDADVRIVKYLSARISRAKKSLDKIQLTLLYIDR